MMQLIKEHCRDERWHGTIQSLIHNNYEEPAKFHAAILELSALNPFWAASFYNSSAYDREFEESLHNELLDNLKIVVEQEKRKKIKDKRKSNYDDLISFFLAFHELKYFEDAKNVCGTIFDRNNLRPLDSSSPYWFNKLYETILNHIDTYYFHLRYLITANERRANPFRNGSERDILVRGMRRFIDQPLDDGHYPFRLIRMVDGCGLYSEFAHYVGYDIEALLNIIHRLERKAEQFDSDLLSAQAYDATDLNLRRNWNILYKYLLAYLLDEKGREALHRYDGDSPILTNMLRQLSEFGEENALQPLQLPNAELNEKMYAAWNSKRNGFEKPFHLCFCFSPNIPVDPNQGTKFFPLWWQCESGHEWTINLRHAAKKRFVCSTCKMQAAAIAKEKRKKAKTISQKEPCTDTFVKSIINDNLYLKRITITEHEQAFIEECIYNIAQEDQSKTLLPLLFNRVYAYSTYREFWECVEYDTAWLNTVFATVTGPNGYHMEFIIGDDISWLTEILDENKTAETGETNRPLTAVQWNKLYRFLWSFLEKGPSVEELLSQSGEGLNPVLANTLRKISNLGLTPDSLFHLESEEYDQKLYEFWDPVANEAEKPFAWLMATSETPPTTPLSIEDMRKADIPRINWRCAEQHEWSYSLRKMAKKKFRCPLCLHGQQAYLFF
ncbi:MAG: hypothetical protein J6Z82_00660 [Schwartzia sp.]|nr:hypothetical protein [Schwartzia sp. (in: firmicutes)]